MQQLILRCFLVLASLPTLVGCPNRKNVPCVADSNCDLGPGGVCRPGPSESWCAYPDTSCPGGYRYSDFDVGDGVSGECVGDSRDAGVDGIDGRCDVTKDFQPPVHALSLSSSLEEVSFSLASNELLAFLHRESPATLSMGTRSSPEDMFEITSSATALETVVGVDGSEYMPSSSADGLILYFVRSDQATSAIYVSMRGSADAAFSAGVDVAVDGARLVYIVPQISRDGSTLYWYDYGAAEGKIYAATRNGLPSVFITKRAATSFKTAFNYAVSKDELTLYYSDVQGNDVFRSTRASKDVPFQPGVPLANVNSTAADLPLAVSDDDCVLYIRSARPGGVGATDIWIARRP